MLQKSEKFGMNYCNFYSFVSPPFLWVHSIYLSSPNFLSGVLATKEEYPFVSFFKTGSRVQIMKRTTESIDSAECLDIYFNNSGILSDQ